MTKHINSVIPIVKMKKNSQTGGKIFEWSKAFFAVKRLKNPPPHEKVFDEFQTLQLKM